MFLGFGAGASRRRDCSCARCSASSCAWCSCSVSARAWRAARRWGSGVSTTRIGFQEILRPSLDWNALAGRSPAVRAFCCREEARRLSSRICPPSTRRHRLTLRAPFRAPALPTHKLCLRRCCRLLLLRTTQLLARCCARTSVSQNKPFVVGGHVRYFSRWVAQGVFDLCVRLPQLFCVSPMCGHQLGKAYYLFGLTPLPLFCL